MCALYLVVMQGKKDYQEELFINFQLSEFVPEENLYRRLKGILNLDYLYAKTAPYYGSCGQKSIDPVVFFKLSLVGYLENIISDRQLMNHCSMRLDIRYFINYKLTEPMPWHSTMSRTRDLLPEALFKEVFEDILRQCIEGGLVSGHTQVVDSAPVKANASMDSLELKVPAEELDEHLARVRYQSTPDREKHAPKRKAKQNKATEEQQHHCYRARTKRDKGRNKNWQKDPRPTPRSTARKQQVHQQQDPLQPHRPRCPHQRKTRQSQKTELPEPTGRRPRHPHHHPHWCRLCRQARQPLFAKYCRRTTSTPQENGPALYHPVGRHRLQQWRELRPFRSERLDAFIPPHGTYKGGPEGFTYHKEGDYWLCRNKQKVTYRKTFIEKKNDNKKKLYLTKPSQCKGCPFKRECIGNSPERRITITAYTEEYARTIAKLKTPRGRRMKALRQSVVEPVFGILTQFMGMRKLYTKGIQNANKQMLMAATAYNLKKLLKYTKTPPRSVAKSMKAGNPLAVLKRALGRLILSPYTEPEFCT